MLRNRGLQAVYRLYPFSKGRGRVFNLAHRCIGGFELMCDRNGNLFLVDLHNFIDNCLFLDRAYEPADVAWLRQASEKNRSTCFIDIGAHIGVYTVSFAADVNIQRVICFEPDPRNFAQLLCNVAINGLSPKVVPHNAAVSAASGTAPFFTADVRVDRECGKLNTGTSSLEHKAHRSSGTPTTVPVLRLDDLVNIKGEAITIKIDVEGHEVDVLEGMRDLLVNNRCVVLVEVWAHSDKRRTVDLLFAGCGYVKAASHGDNHLYSVHRSDSDCV